MSMPVKIALKYYKAKQVLEAREFLKELNLVSYPHMKKKDRKELYKTYREIADQGKVDKKNIVKVDDMVSKLNHGR
jgi:hypothetical protein